jgi:glycosyltransferase involved in cell wall biosynthesis
MISVIIHHSGDRDEFLEEALESVLNQSGRNYLKEIIIIDNNKSPKKQKALNKHKSVKIKHIKLKHYIEPSYRLTLAGIKHAREKYVAYLADDDIWDENHIARAVESLVSHDNVAASFCATIQFKNRGRYWLKPEDSFARHFACTSRTSNKTFFSEEDIIVGSLLGPIFHFSTLVAKKDIIYKAIKSIRCGNPFDTDRIIPLEIAKNGLIVADNRFGAFIRSHDEQESNRLYRDGIGRQWWERTTTNLLNAAKNKSLNLRIAFEERMRSKKISLSDLYKETNSMGQIERLINEGVLVRQKIIKATSETRHSRNLIKNIINIRIDRKIIRPIEQLVKRVRKYFKNAA